MLPLLSAVTAFEKELWLQKRPVLRILSVDPGVITGVAVIWFDARTGEIVGWAETLITHDETKQVWDLMALLRVLADFGRVWIVIEDFTVDQVNMSPEFLSPVRIGHKFAMGAEIMGTGELGQGPVMGCIEGIQFQSRSRKADYQDKRLKLMGFFTPGPDHRRDATRHALVRWKQLEAQLPDVVPAAAARHWEPALVPVELTPKVTGRSFNGKPTGSHGQPAPAAVTRADMARFAELRTVDRQATNYFLGRTTLTKPTDAMEAAIAGSGLKWVPLQNGMTGWVLEHDPETQSGIAPRRAEATVTAPVPAVSKPKKQLPETEKAAPNAPVKRLRRAPKRLV